MNKFWKLPPRIKILEALGAIADGRIKIISDEKKEKRIVKAICLSSNRDKTYNITYIPEDNSITSDDNGSKFKGYLGYPSIALLMIEKKLDFDIDLANSLAGIPWKKLNEKFKNYYLTEIEIKKILKNKGINEEKIDNFIEIVLKQIKEKKFKKI
ncbi:MAG: hypothetical protein QXQ30_00450 [Candidatus Pacearchaeota archaeon]